MTNKERTFKLHIPVAQYGFFEVEIPESEAVAVYNKYAESPIKQKLVQLQSFTGETIYFNEEKHIYYDAKGNRLISGSEFAESKFKEFDLEGASKGVADKTGVSQDDIKDMWERNGEISRNLGNALHLAMEQYFTHKDNGTDKEYHLPKHPFLREAVLSFPDKDKKIMPEVLVSDVTSGKVGRIDGILFHKGKEVSLVDFKSDANVEKNLAKHEWQLSFYASILEAHGYKVKDLIIWNYTTEWKDYKLTKKSI